MESFFEFLVSVINPYHIDGLGLFWDSFEWFCFMISMLYSHLQHHNNTIIKTQENFFRKIFTSHFIARVWKDYSRFACERELETEQKLQYFDPHSYGRQRCVFLVLQGCSTGRPEAHSAGWSATSYQQFLCTPTQSGAPSPFSLVWLSLPYLVYNSIRSLTGTNLTPLLTELYNSSTPTQSPTRSLKLHVWLSSSGNNCHAVHRSLSYGASVYEYTMGIFFTSSHFVSQFPPTRFPLITAILFHHLGMAFLAGSKAKIQQVVAPKVFSSFVQGTVIED